MPNGTPDPREMLFYLTADDFYTAQMALGSPSAGQIEIARHLRRSYGAVAIVTAVDVDGVIIPLFGTEHIFACEPDDVIPTYIIHPSWESALDIMASLRVAGTLAVTHATDAERIVDKLGDRMNGLVSGELLDADDAEPWMFQDPDRRGSRAARQKGGKLAETQDKGDLLQESLFGEEQIDG